MTKEILIKLQEALIRELLDDGVILRRAFNNYKRLITNIVDRKNDNVDVKLDLEVKIEEKIKKQ